jgi:DNA replication protein
MNQVKLNELIKSKIINIPLYVLGILKEFNLTIDEMILLLFLYNQDGEIFNPNLIAESLDMELLSVMKIVSNLSDKELVNITTKTRNKVKEEVIDLSGLFEKVTIKMMDKLNNKIGKEEINIYDILKEEFGRKLTPMECETVDSWKKNNYPDELIVEAIREATLNGVSSLRYIDKILYEWNKKGYKKKEDIKKIDNKSSKVEIYNCDWLDSDEEL